VATSASCEARFRATTLPDRPTAAPSHAELPAGKRRSVDRGTCGPGIQPRNCVSSGRRCCKHKRKAAPGASISRDATDVSTKGAEGELEAEVKKERDEADQVAPVTDSITPVTRVRLALNSESRSGASIALTGAGCDCGNRLTRLSSWC